MNSRRFRPPFWTFEVALDSFREALSSYTTFGGCDWLVVEREVAARLVCSRGRAIREHTETLGSFYSLLLASKPVSAERASLKESSATKIVKNEGWK
ncbi:hypothetical protein F511_24580 [Dorcoceras hygrometricum]|uniref:Uncharacterized protein n=1 Tax=Dorcoceras hygrometricum TaxID=472368 RepID=A0A2Z7DH60_9LAMI|nr:hypothetical protein F511_24580 [Dorcoceras hygrometricum]